ncbi:MAG TPA: KTSC domain-containing protein [Ignavibacteria bacterium]
MNRISVVSSMIHSIGYEVETSTLEIEFVSDSSVYQYYNFPEYLYNDFMSSDSKGKYFHANIKGKYNDTKVG